MFPTDTPRDRLCASKNGLIKMRQQVIPTVGQRIGRYELIRELGEGGFGVVFLARQVGLDADVAIKLLLLKRQSDANRLQVVERFRQEAEIIKRLEHPCALKIRDIGETEDGIPFLVTEYVRGDDLDEVIKQQPLNVARTARIANQILGCLAEAHALGVVHRDLKPSNIKIRDIIGEEDAVKVLDFGIAKLSDSEGGLETKTDSGFGTPYYMSPEQCRGEKQIDGRADLYALGLILAECLLGRRIVQADSTLAAIYYQVSPEPHDFPPELCQTPIFPVIERATQKNRDWRWADALSMRQALQSIPMDSAVMQQVIVGPLQQTGQQPANTNPALSSDGFDAQPTQQAAPPQAYGAPAPSDQVISGPVPSGQVAAAPTPYAQPGSSATPYAQPGSGATPYAPTVSAPMPQVQVPSGVVPKTAGTGKLMAILFVILLLSAGTVAAVWFLTQEDDDASGSTAAAEDETTPPDEQTTPEPGEESAIEVPPDDSIGDEEVALLEPADGAEAPESESPSEEVAAVEGAAEGDSPEPGPQEEVALAEPPTPRSDDIDPSLPVLLVQATGEESDQHRVRVVIESRPDGAVVRDQDGNILARTPFDGYVVSTEVEVELSIDADGHRSTRIAINMTTDETQRFEERLRRRRQREPTPEPVAEPLEPAVEEEPPEPEVNPFGLTEEYVPPSSDDEDESPFGSTREY